MSSTAELEEYKVLREEVQSRVHGFIQVFTISLLILVPFISGIIIYWLQSRADMKADPSLFYAYILLTPLLILIPFAYFLTSLRKDIFRCGTYIQVFLEGNGDFRWESALSEFRKIYGRETIEPAFLIYWGLFLICSGLFGYSLYFLSQSSWNLFVILFAAILLLIAYLDFRRVRTKTREAFCNQWRNIKEAMDKRRITS